MVEGRQGKSTGGRPPQALKLNDESNYAVGLKLRSHAISAVITDLNAEVVHAEVFDLPAAGGAAQAAVVPAGPVLCAVSGAVRDWIAHAGIAPSAVVGVGVGIGGLVDAEGGVCRYSPFFGWTDVPVAVPLAADLGLPVLVDNDVNTLTIAEQWFGDGHGVDHFVVVSVGEGIGAGIVVNGKLYRGADGGAGELGRLPIADSGVRCSCGSTGCLEAVASDGAILRQVRAAGLTAVRTIADVRRAAEGGNEACAAALRDAGAMLGIGIAGIVNVLNPRLVILCGEGIKAGPIRFEAMTAALRGTSSAGWSRTSSSSPNRSTT